MRGLRGSRSLADQSAASTHSLAESSRRQICIIILPACPPLLPQETAMWETSLHISAITMRLLRTPAGPKEEAGLGSFWLATTQIGACCEELQSVCKWRCAHMSASSAIGAYGNEELNMQLFDIQVHTCLHADAAATSFAGASRHRRGRLSTLQAAAAAAADCLSCGRCVTPAAPPAAPAAPAAPLSSGTPAAALPACGVCCGLAQRSRQPHSQLRQQRLQQRRPNTNAHASRTASCASSACSASSSLSYSPSSCSMRNVKL